MTRNAECDNRRQMYFFFSTIACVCGRWPSGTVGSGTDLRELSFGFSLPIANENGCLSSGERAVRREICISSPENPAATCGKPFWHDNVVPQVAASFFGATMSPRKLRQAISVRICHPATCGGEFRVRNADCPAGILHFRPKMQIPHRTMAFPRPKPSFVSLLFAPLAGFIQEQTPNDLSGGRLGFDVYTRFSVTGGIPFPLPVGRALFVVYPADDLFDRWLLAVHEHAHAVDLCSDPRHQYEASVQQADA